MNTKDIAKLLGKSGGKKTAKLYGKNHYIEAQKKSVAARLAKKAKAVDNSIDNRLQIE